MKGDLWPPEPRLAGLEGVDLKKHLGAVWVILVRSVSERRPGVRPGWYQQVHRRTQGVAGC